jgi:hypothetical protein
VSESYYVLDGDDRITRVTGSIRATLGPFVGHTIWEASPRAQPLFSPHFAEARATGLEVEFTAFYGGRLSLRRVVPAGDVLTVFVTDLLELDVRTLATLGASLRAIESELAARELAPPDRPGRASLQALP